MLRRQRIYFGLARPSEPRRLKEVRKEGHSGKKDAYIHIYIHMRIDILISIHQHAMD